MMRKISRSKKKKKIFDQIKLDKFNANLHRPRTSARVLVGIVIIALLLIGSVFQKVKIIQLAQEIEGLNRERQLIEEKNAELKTILLKLADGKRLIKVAEDRLEMVFPDTELLPVEEKYKAADLRE